MSTEDPATFGLILSALEKVYYFVAPSHDDRDRWYDCMKEYSRVLLRNLADNYEMGRVVGCGNYAKVHAAISLGNRAEFAIKSLSKSKLRGNIRNLVFVAGL